MSGEGAASGPEGPVGTPRAARAAGAPRAAPPGLAVARAALPGLALTLAVALLARLLAGLGSVPEAVLALALGAALRNAAPRAVPAACQPGLRFTHRYLLRAAIVLLGGGLSFAAVVRVGGQTLPIILLCLVVSFSLCLALARLVRLSGRVGTLLGAGTGICGATAILTVGPLIAASEAEIAYAVGTIFTYNALALVVYPAIGHGLALGDLGFGTWAGTAVNDTAAAVATGLDFGPEAGKVATVVKLTRTVLLVPLAVGIGLIYAYRAARAGGGRIGVRRMIPWFVGGFLGMALLNTVGAIPPAVAQASADAAKLLIVMVLASVGLGMSLAQVRQMGARPFLVGLVVGAAMGGISLGLVWAAGLAGG